jgi:hypothetical protein
MALVQPGAGEGALGDVDDEILVEVDDASFFKSAKRDPHYGVAEIGPALEHGVVKLFDRPGARPVFMENLCEHLPCFMGLVADSLERRLGAVLLKNCLGGLGRHALRVGRIAHDAGSIGRSGIRT